MSKKPILRAIPDPNNYLSRQPLGSWQLNPTEAQLPEFTFAAAVIERWGMIAAIPDGEDSAGRQKLRLASPEELVARAVATTKLFFQAVEDNQWTISIPEPDEATAIVAAAKEAAEETAARRIKHP